MTHAHSHKNTTSKTGRVGQPIPLPAYRNHLHTLRHLCDVTIKDMNHMRDKTYKALSKLHDETHKLHAEACAELHRLKNVTRAHHSLHNGLYDEYLKGFRHAVEILQGDTKEFPEAVQLLQDELYELTRDATPTH